MIFSAIPNINSKATTAINQTFTCNIRNLSEAVHVTWKDNENITIEDTEGYTIRQGIVDNNNVQTSTLTISAAKLGALDTSSPLTWKCAAQSLRFPDSERSADSHIVVTFLTLGINFSNYAV